MAFALKPLVPEAVASAPVLAVDLGGTRVRTAVVLPDGRVAERAETRTRSEAGPEAVIDDIIGLLNTVRERAGGLRPSELAGVGIAAPGPLDPATGRLLEPPNLGSSFRGTDMTGPIGRALGLPAALERDTNVALLGEAAFGAARGARHAIYLTVSTGVGGAILNGGQMLAGADGLAGELGHLVIDVDGPPCSCG